MKVKKEANILLERHLKELGLVFDKEYRLCSERRWKSDYRITNVLHSGQMVLIEIEGGIYTQGRHTRGAGYQKDMDKYNKAAMLGYALLRFSTQDVLRGRAKEFLREHLT